MTIEEAQRFIDSTPKHLGYLASSKAPIQARISELKNLLYEEEEKLRDIERQEKRCLADIKKAEHAAAGLCQKTVYRDIYSGPCDKKAKPGETYCGIHLRGKT